MINQAQSQAIFRDLAQRLQTRIANSGSGRVNTVRADFDSRGNPMLFLSRGGNESAGQPVIGLRISPIQNAAPDIFGNAIGFVPHKIEFAYELDANGKPEPSALDVELCMYEIAPIGTRMVIEQIADGTAVTATSMSAATPALELASLYWPGTGNV